jgi:hypothetical protein
MSKGSRQRPVDREKFSRNWDAVDWGNVGIHTTAPEGPSLSEVCNYCHNKLGINQGVYGWYCDDCWPQVTGPRCPNCDGDNHDIEGLVCTNCQGD